MKRYSFVFVAIFALICVVAFSGQRRSTTARPVRAEPKESVASSVPERPQVRRDAETVGQPVREHEGSGTEIPLLVLRPHEIQWPDRSDPTAPRSVSLLGDRAENKLYVTRTFVPKGKKIIPHTHGDSRTVVVLSGTYYYGIGETFDETKLIKLPPGSFLTEPAGIPHYNWARDEDVIVQTTAIGPSGTRVIPDKPDDEKQ